LLIYTIFILQTSILPFSEFFYNFLYKKTGSDNIFIIGLFKIQFVYLFKPLEFSQTVHTSWIWPQKITTLSNSSLLYAKQLKVVTLMVRA